MLHLLPYPDSDGSHAEPDPIWGRYGEYLIGQSRQATSVAELFRDVPEALWLVRGIDVASDELAIPTWVLVPLYRQVRKAAALAAAALAPATRRPPTLRTTAHTGEDFRHMMEGLRRVFEAVMYLLDSSGSRLGHATALGLEPRLWAESVGAVMMPIEVRLWDLAFEWRLYSSYRVGADFRAVAPPGRPGRVENGIREMSERMFGTPQEPQHIAELQHVLHHLFVPPLGVEYDGNLDSFRRAHERLDPEHVRSYRTVIRLLRKYRQAGREQIFRRGQELVDISLDGSEIAALYAVQNALRRAVARRGIVVEVNPSSNLLIGDLLDLRNHPVLRLFPLEALPDAPPPVPIVVGSDDPITFDTCLLREYALLHEAASAAGYSETVTLEWLCRIRQMSMDARFTVPWPRGTVRLLLNAFDRYLMTPARSPIARELDRLARKNSLRARRLGRG